MIKRIQLRGISRTPSDRMNEDGGVSESMNMYLDQGESAPAFVPEDVTEQIGLPDGLKAERIFIHKTANYENSIVVLKDKIVAYTPTIDEDVDPLLVMEFTEGETFIDITSMGNTLIVTTSKTLYYILYKDLVYTFLGNKLPFPYINFEKRKVDKTYEATYEGSLRKPPLGTQNDLEDLLFASYMFYAKFDDEYASSGKSWVSFYQDSLSIFPESLWTKEAFIDPSDDLDSPSYWLHTLKKRIDTLKKDIGSSAFREGHYMGPIFIRYEVETINGAFTSMPILLNSSNHSISIFTRTSRTARARRIYWEEDPQKEVYAFEYGSANHSARLSIDAYDIFASMQLADNFESWRDVVQNINIYISEPTTEFLNSEHLILLNSRTVSKEDNSNINLYTWEEEATASYGPEADMTTILTSQSDHFFKILSIPITEDGAFTEEFYKLQEGQLITHPTYDELLVQPRLAESDMNHYQSLSTNLTSYNNALLLVQPSQIMEYDYNTLNAREVVYRESAEKFETPKTTTFDITYFLRTITGTRVVKKQIVSYDWGPSYEDFYSFQTFPDKRAYRMVLKMTIKYRNGSDEVRYADLEMHPHPYIDCAYYYGGLDTLLQYNTHESPIADIDTPVNAVDELENKVLMSATDDPFSFPIERRFTFQSKVIGVAVATTALSQGQFGQYPLYVFTEDGIWAMEAGADGSFVSQKPLSREVCINPDSITAIDNAVVFVTAKGVMVIQGSQVTNISPNMNGRHYILDDQAEKVIRISYTRDNNFNDLIEPMQDEDSFMSFIKDAKIAYDYVGQRLIFISPSNKKFQYVYKLDTQTWHKVSFSGLELVAPINSFPECLITVEAEGMDPDVYQAVSDTLELNKDQMKDFLAGNMITKYHQKDKGDKYYWTEKCNTLYELYEVDISTKIGEYIEATIDIDMVKPGVDTSSSDAQWVCALLGISKETLDSMKNGENLGIYTFLSSIYDIDLDYSFLDEIFLYSKLRESEVFETNLTLEEYEAKRGINTKVFSMSTVLDDSRDQQTAKGCIISRPFDLGEPDVYKTIKDVRIRGQFRKGAVKYILEGSDDGEAFHVIRSRRGKSWKMFRIILLADLEPTERISWVDIDYETRFTNRLR